MKTSLPLVAAAMALMAAGWVSPAAAATLDDVRERGLLCGVNPDLAGFATATGEGVWSGFDVDLCRALAAAATGKADAVTFVPLTNRERFDALQAGDVDVVVRDTTWTMARDTARGLRFTGVSYYNGVGFLVPRTLAVDSALQLTRAEVCVESGTPDQIAVADYFAAKGMVYSQVLIDGDDSLLAAFQSGRCNALAAEVVRLYGLRLRLSHPDDSIVLPDIISKEPYGPVVREGDDQWFNIVKWVLFALLNAEELGVTSANVDQMKAGDNQAVRRLLGVDGSFGADVYGESEARLTSDWAANAVKAVGNYGEIFARNLGAGSRLQMARGLNALWSEGGIQYAPPIR
jgi:general L-amino acid transport system substrate-binding protein